MIQEPLRGMQGEPKTFRNLRALCGEKWTAAFGRVAGARQVGSIQEIRWPPEMVQGGLCDLPAATRPVEETRLD